MYQAINQQYVNKLQSLPLEVFKVRIQHQADRSDQILVVRSKKLQVQVYFLTNQEDQHYFQEVHLVDQVEDCLVILLYLLMHQQEVCLEIHHKQVMLQVADYLEVYQSLNKNQNKRLPNSHHFYNQEDYFQVQLNKKNNKNQLEHYLAEIQVDYLVQHPKLQHQLVAYFQVVRKNKVDCSHHLQLNQLYFQNQLSL